ncbi:MAG: adenine-specific methyltransferase EcoRI family protein, partial [bacterium]
RDITRDGQINFDDLEWEYLNGDGDFRSPEVTKLRDEADIIITNPPFSLFREFLAWIVEANKKFLVIGNLNAITYKEVFPLIKENKLWLGPTISSGDREFEVPENYPLLAAGWRVDDKGKKYIRVKGVRWYTNLDHGRRHTPLVLMTEKDVVRYGLERPFEKYDNYDAIEVPKTKWIPSDYSGIMGVPITFLDKYCPEQFEILGATQRGCHDAVPDFKKYDDYVEMSQSGGPTGCTGGKTNENANLLVNDGKKNYFKNKEGRIVQSAYQRIFIRHKNL